MESLKAFTIGTSGAVFLSHLYLLKLADKEYYDYPLKVYVLLLPIYYGLMNVIGSYIGRSFNLKLDIQLLIISLISITTIVLFNYFYSRKRYKPYKEYTTKEWKKYIVRNGLRHLFAFNVVIYFFTKYFDSSWLLRTFIIGSSFFSYYQTYLKIIQSSYQPGYMNYDYKDAILIEPIQQGIYWTIGLYVLHRVMKYKLMNSLIFYSIIGSIIQLYIVNHLKLYNFNIIPETVYIQRMIVSSIIQVISLNYVMKNLK